MARRGDLTTPLQGLVGESLAHRYEGVGVARAASRAVPALMSAAQSGAFIGLGVLLQTLGLAAAHSLPYGLAMLLGGLAFWAGVAPLAALGARVFAADHPAAMAYASGRITARALMRSLGVTLAGNVLGAAVTAVAAFAGLRGLPQTPALAAQVLGAAAARCNEGFLQAMSLGLLCSVAVNAALWLCMGARSAADKALAVAFPVVMGAAAGFEHCVANVYLVLLGLLVRWANPALPGVLAASGYRVDIAALSLTRFLLTGLLPVALGNLVGGTVAVAAFYRLIYVRGRRGPASAGRSC